MSLHRHMNPVPVSEGTFTAQLPEGWGQGRALFGGLTCGLVARAMHASVPEDRALRSFAATFVKPATPGPAQITVERTGSGRSATHAEGRLIQDGLRLSAQGTFAGPRASALSLLAPPGPSLPPPDSLQPLPNIPGLSPEFTQHVDFRFALGSFPLSGADKAEQGGWFRYPGASAPLDAAWILALLDTWPPPVLTAITTPAPASSATLWAHLNPEAMAGRTVEDWFIFRSRTTTARDGWADLQADLWASDGTHLASMRQLTAFFG